MIVQINTFIDFIDCYLPEDDTEHTQEKKSRDDW